MGYFRKKVGIFFLETLRAFPGKTPTFFVRHSSVVFLYSFNHLMQGYFTSASFTI